MLFRRRFGFSPPEKATAEGIVGIGGPLDVPTLQCAYRQGIFPWPHTGLPLLWFNPDPRAVLDFDDLHIPERLARRRKKLPLHFTVDTAFATIIASCRTAPRPGQEGTWITPKMVAAFLALHEVGDAHSVEAWDTEGNLVAGLYGVTAGGVFSGESMFHTVSDASKLCVLFLVEYLKERGATWIDIQTMTPHFEMLGAKEISRDDYLARLAAAQAAPLVLFDKEPKPPIER
ncbi:leucyl/phenylalanyl-tRNA--protein transferase [Armatimonas rosea]|uniref:Leucyl/phenylalanyl-tRNA--protein transferase n=1 Tax=Armatimonas rosea TaxID=685828 RepID=A0A7W9SR68_ARMRO|nr:leucyl/phenylalanyl-tRNA--protein transferase [Armatimonas rosea]